MSEPKLIEICPECGKPLRPTYDPTDPSPYIGDGHGNWILVKDYYLSHEEVEALEQRRVELDAKFRLDVGIMLENNRVLTEERDMARQERGDWESAAHQNFGAAKIHNERADKAESRLVKAQEILDEIRIVLNEELGIGWIEKEFEASDYDTCDSVDVTDGVSKIMREASLGSE